LFTAPVSLVAPASVPRVVTNDADDARVIAAAVAARAELIVNTCEVVERLEASG
jgi:hypothetical protein